jgi:uncharacterized membrane protein
MIRRVGRYFRLRSIGPSFYVVRAIGTAMALQIITWLIALPLLGTVAGLRCMTPMAVVCWFAYLGHLSLDGSWDQWVPKLSTAIIFTILAIGELIADKLPKTPARTTIGPLMCRLVVGGLIGAIVADGLDGSGLEGVILGVLGALVGTFGGYLIRRDLVQRLGWKDMPVALAEDGIAIGCAILALGIITG